MPTSVNMGEETLKPEDAPLFTICFDPPVALPVAESLVCKNGDNADPSDLAFMFGLCNQDPLQFSILMLMKLTEKNLTLDKLLAESGLPVIKQDFTCFHTQRFFKKQPSRCDCKSNCTLNKLGFSTLDEKKVRTDIGQWETNIYWNNNFQGLHICSTLQLDIPMEKGTDNMVVFNSILRREKDYKLSNST